MYEKEFEEWELVIYRMPYRVLRRMARVTDWTFTTEVEYGAMVYGNRDRPETITMGVVRRGTPKGAEVKIAGNRRSILMFHTHPWGYKALPSTGDIAWVLWFHDYQDRRKTFEAFAIGRPTVMDEGEVIFYQVIDWDRMREIYEHIKPADLEYGRYLRGERPDCPPEVYEAHEYLWRRLHLFTRRRRMTYNFKIVELPEQVQIHRGEHEELWTSEDVVKIVDLMRRFPEMERPWF
jgi:hypothetical protein